jgi:hypothetical protein
MKYRSLSTFVLVIFVSCWLGCGPAPEDIANNDPQTNQDPGTETQSPSDPPENETPITTSTTPGDQGLTSPDVPAIPPRSSKVKPATIEKTETVETESVEAGVGVGKKGRSLDNETGIGKAIAQPAISLFAAKERIVFEIQIPHAVNLFQAIEGRKPKSDEEFMDKIVKANQIKLPELPKGGRYYYDPETEQLMVERPKR